MNFLTNISIVLLIIGLSCICLIGCNTSEIARQTKALWDVDAEIELLEMGLVETKSKLELLPLTELARKELEIKAKNLKGKLVIKQAQKGRLLKTTEELKREDDALIASVDETAQTMLPYGLGGIATSLLLMGRGFLRNKNLKRVFKSIEPLIAKASPAEITDISIAQGSGGKRLVDGFQGKRKMLPV